MDGKIPPQEQAHDNLPSLAEVNLNIAQYLRDGIDASSVQEIPDVMPLDKTIETFFIKIPGVDDIVETIERLEKTPFDEKLFDSRCIEIFEKRTEEIAKMKLLQHENAIRRGQVTIFNVDESDEMVVKIPAKHLDQFREAQKHSLMASPDVAQSDTPLNKDAQTVQLIIDTATIHFSSQIQKAVSLLPDRDTILEHIRTGQVDIFDVFTQNFLKPQELHFTKDNRDIRNFKRAVRKFCDNLQAYIDSPETVLADIAMEAIKDTIDESITNNLQDNIVLANSHLYATLQIQKDKAHREESANDEDKLSKREQRILAEIALRAQQDTEKVSLKEIQTSEATHHTVVATPWLVAKEREVSELITSTGSVYILDGVSDELTAIRDETLSKNKELEHKINVKIQTAAEKIATGNLPWNTINTFKMLKRGTETPDRYSKESIYYITDNSPNAPRIYFSMKKASELEIVADGNQPLLNPQQWCMILIAITDKDQQIATLKQLTGRSTEQLKALGAGSI
jgi:hypothetical protein